MQLITHFQAMHCAEHKMNEQPRAHLEMCFEVGYAARVCLTKARGLLRRLQLKIHGTGLRHMSVT